MNSILKSIAEIASNKNVHYYLVKDLSKYTPSAADTDTKTVVINLNWHNKEQIPFHFAHELGHIFMDDESDKILYFTPLKKTTEMNANKFAVDLLLALYAQDKMRDDLNISNFMSYFAIPSHLEDLVEKEFIKYKGESQ